jgi:hypothetical protein
VEHLHAALADAALLARVLGELAAKPARRLDAPAADGVSLRTLLHEPEVLARRLARALARRAYQPAPAEVRRVLLDKERELYRFHPLDEVVHAAAAHVLGARAAPHLSPALWSYRRGRSSFQAVGELAAFVRAHRRQRPDPRARGVIVLRADVRRYGESIPLGPAAPVWGDLGALLAPDDEAGRTLLTALLRPELTIEGAAAEPLLGLPTGSPLANVVTNLYLAPADAVLSAVPGAFYARYGDDLCFAHAEAEVVAEAERALLAVLVARGLALNPEKRRLVHWNGAGRARGATAGTTHITYLGCRVAFDGTVGLPGVKVRELLGDLRPRVRRAARLARTLPPAERAPAVCGAVTRALAVHAGSATPLASWLLTIVTDRRQLRQLDHLVALEVAGALTGRRGPRALRLLGYRRLRREHGLPSLVVRRNRRGRPE